MRPGQTYDDLKKAEGWSVVPGDRVRHAAHGEGQVERVNSLGQAEVRFGSGSKAVPLKSLVPMEEKRKSFPLSMSKVYAI